MITLDAFFYILVALFAIIGALRGFKKELLVTSAGIFALFTIEIVVPKIFKASLTGTRLFWVNLAVVLIFAILAYQTPAYRRFIEIGLFQVKATGSMALGALVGAINGYIYVSTVMYFLAQANYPFPKIIPPDLATEAGQAAAKILTNAFPAFLQGENVYYAVVAAVLLIIGAFV